MNYTLDLDRRDVEARKMEYYCYNLQRWAGERGDDRERQEAERERERKEQAIKDEQVLTHSHINHSHNLHTLSHLQNVTTT
jgi:Cft2 family RNA processing exonuclease